MSETQQTEAQKAERDNLLRQAYGKATAQLREQHRDEFENLRMEAAKELGVDWTPRKKPEEKAAEEFDRLLAEFPHLAKRVEGGQNEALPAQQPVADTDPQ
jgi:hypothetical protein